VKNAYRHLDSASDRYDGKCEEGDPADDPDRWYNQPNYVELWVESATLQEDLLQFQGDRNVKVVASRGFTSVSYMDENCQRLRQIAEEHDHIEKIIILYFGDYDNAGEDIAYNLERGLEWYGVPNFEFIRVASRQNR
jgi:hypothetical protein